MTKAEKIDYALAALEQLYPETPVPLHHKDPFTLLVAVVLSAQCTDLRVNQVTPHLFRLADNPIDMNKLDIDTIYEIIKPCGLAPQKSSAIKGLSKILIDEHNCNVPCTFEELERLPGVGHKTASVVMSQGHGFPAFPVDTHIHRCAQRWGLTAGKNVIQTERDLKTLFPENLWNKLHLQIIFYAREFCQARSCFGVECEICRTCYPDRKHPIKVNKP